MYNKETNYYIADIDTLIPYINNARTHDEKQVAQIAASIKEFGFLSPIIVSGDNTILCGHGRYYAAQKLGLKKVPCIKEEYLTETQKKAYIIADNKLSLNAGWDEELLRVEIESLQGADFDIGLTGFDENDLADLFHTNGEEAEEDNFDIDGELAKPCISKTGDIWRIGKHTVICGDTTVAETYEKLLGNTKVNLVCTDAPYFVNLENKSGRIANDNLNDKEAYEFLLKAFTNFKNAMANDASIYEFYATMKTRVFYDAFEDAGFRVGAGLIWKKPRAPFMRTDWKFNMEPIIWGWKRDGKHKWYGDQKQTAVFEFDGIKDSEKEGFGHPSSKPVPLIAYLISQCTATNGIVLDGFLGSATTLIACEQMDRICYGIELEPKFVDVACARYVEYKKGVSNDVYVIRNGEKIAYSDLVKEVEGADGE